VQAIRDRERLFAEFGRDGEVFARPTSTHKLFVGRLIAEDDFASALAPTRYDLESQVVIAEPRDIGREWRLVVVRGEVVAGSRYAAGGVRDISPDCPAEVFAFADSLLGAVAWRPDDVFMLDACESQDGLRLVELNSFSCSWLYACDLPTVVECVSRTA
jgi:hypothetical protein